jgi:hypothetical protein
MDNYVSNHATCVIVYWKFHDSCRISSDRMWHGRSRCGFRMSKAITLLVSVPVMVMTAATDMLCFQRPAGVSAQSSASHKKRKHVRNFYLNQVHHHACDERRWWAPTHVRTLLFEGLDNCQVILLPAFKGCLENSSEIYRFRAMLPSCMSPC